MTGRVRLTRPVFRGHNPLWAFSPTSGIGAARFGGRFNRPGVEALYTSFRYQTAWLEVQQGFPYKAQPLTICQYDVDCEDIVDLSDDNERRRWGVSWAALSCPWEDLADQGLTPPSWVLADRLIAEGVSGLIVPSFAARAGPLDINVVFWTWSDRPPHKVVVVDDFGRLPKTT